MGDGRIIITREDIDEFLKQEHKNAFIITPILFLILVLMCKFSKWITGWIFWDILYIIIGLFVLFCFLLRIHHILQLKNGTFFTVTTDVLRRKDEHVIQVGDDAMRLYFQCDQYFMHFRYRDRHLVYLAYGMDYQTLYDIASVGDTYTLIKSGKNVLLAYNNKFFDVQC